MSASSRRGVTVCPLCAVIVMSGGVCTSTEYHDRDDQKPFRGSEPRAGGEPRLAGGAAGGHRHASLLHPEGPKEIGPPRGEGEPQDGGDGGKDAEQERGGGEKPFPGDADHGRKGIRPVAPLPPPVEKRQDDRPVEKNVQGRRGGPEGGEEGRHERR